MVSWTGLLERGGWPGLKKEGTDGKVHRADCTGLLVYTRDGHMSVQVMYQNQQAGTAAGPGSMRKADTRPLLADMRSTNALTPSLTMLRAHLCELL